MLRLALAFELRTLLRNRAGVMALVAFLAVGALAIVIGHRHVGLWQEAIATAHQAQEDSVAEARGFIARGEKGPADRAWVDLAQPLWQDWYAGTRVAREPGPLAGIAAGAVDPAPAVFRVNRMADPLATGGHRIENPELDAGAVDLVFVLGLLTPLLIGVLGFEIGGRERQERVDRMVVMQAGELRSWLVARMIAVMAIGGTASAVLCLAAGLMGGAGWVEVAMLIGMALAYTALWGGLLLAVNAHARSIRSAALSFGTLWALLCVLLPTVAAEVVLSRVDADFGLAETLDARALRYAAYERELESVLPELYALYPELEQLPAASDDPLDPTTGRHAYDVLLATAISQRHDARRRQEREAQAISERTAWITPVVALELGLERMAGVGPEAASDYRDHLMVAVQDRAHWVVNKAWAKTPLSANDFEALVKDAPPPFRPHETRVIGPMLMLLAWGAATWLFAFVSLGRAERRRVEE